MKNGRYQILHVEDDENRYTNYKHMVDAELDAANIQHDVYWAQTIEIAITFIVNNPRTIDLILLDIALGTESESGLSLVRQLRDKLNSDVPIFVVSANVDRYKTVLDDMQKCRMISGFSEPIGLVWTRLLKHILQRQEVNILHISDIHEGKFFAFSDLVVDKPTILSNLCNQLGKIDIVIISGDNSSTNIDSDYRNAKKLLDILKIKLNLTANEFVIVPGNHDRCRDCSDSTVFSNFLNFLYSFYSEQNISPRNSRYPERDLQDFDNVQNVFDKLFSIAVYPEQKTIVVGFNSVNPLDNMENIKKECGIQGDSVQCGLLRGGEISSQQLVNVHEELEIIYKINPAARNYVKIATFHHNLFEPSHAQAVKWRPTLINEGNVFSALSDYGFRFILHGHLHYPENYYHRIYSKENGINIISTGTFSGRDRNLCNKFCANKITYEVDAGGLISSPRLWRYEIPADGMTWNESSIILDL